MYWHMGEHGMEFGWLFIFIFTIFIVHLANLISERMSRGTHEESPLRILKRRYAKGGITREEFERMQAEITGKICR